MYFFLRLCFVPISLVGWVVFQLLVKKKKWAAVEGDVRIIAFFLVVWVAVYYFILR